MGTALFGGWACGRRENGASGNHAPFCVTSRAVARARARVEGRCCVDVTAVVFFSGPPPPKDHVSLWNPTGLPAVPVVPPIPWVPIGPFSSPPPHPGSHSSPSPAAHIPMGTPPAPHIPMKPPAPHIPPPPHDLQSHRTLQAPPHPTYPHGPLPRSPQPHTSLRAPPRAAVPQVPMAPTGPTCLFSPPDCLSPMGPTCPYNPPRPPPSRDAKLHPSL